MFPWNPVLFWWLPAAAVILDLLLGDPAGLPHPVNALGRLIRRLETPARRLGRPLIAGGLAVAATCLAAGAGAALMCLLPGPLGWLAGLYLAWSGLALGCLAREGRAALLRIESGDLPAARRSVAMLVSRDVSAMDAPELRRTLAETLSENFNDAFVAPLFWLVCLGPCGLWMYKAASTMDSLWGYRSERWNLLGRAGARLDDALAFVPARLSVVLLRAAAPLVRASGSWPGWDAVRAQAGRMQSPNAGWPMAAAAWLHAGSMGGPAVYAGQQVDKPRLGPDSAAWSAAQLRCLIRHICVAGLLAGCALSGCLGLLALMC